MTLLPFTDCCLLLGVDPKTLRLWLKSANTSWTLHPGDARLKCLTPPQLQHLADLHGRFLPSPLPTATSPVASPSSGAPAPLETCAPSPACASPDPDLRHQLTLLQTQVASLQEQVTNLALALVRTHEWHWQACSLPGAAPARSSSPDSPSPSRSTPPARTPSRTRSHPLPLIEYGTDGKYVVISPTEGILSLVPDSPAWFDWLSSLTAFTFQGVQGRFSTTRKTRQGQRVQAWSAYRSLRGRSCNLYLGLTSHLTLAHLEEMATTIHARLTTV